MKRTMKQMLVAILISVVLGMAVFAQSKGVESSKEVTFMHDLMVKDTLVKHGKYMIVYNTKTGEMKIQKGNTVVASTFAHIESRQSRAVDTLVKLSPKDNHNVLRSITLAGETETMVVNDEVPTAALPQ